jgi:hypothetical protein
MQEYQITLKNEKLGLYHRLSIFFIMILFPVYCYILFFTFTNISGASMFITIAVIGLCLMGRMIFPGIKNRIWLWIFFVLLSVGFSYLRIYWLTATCVLLGIFFLYATKEKIVDFSASRIFYPSFPSKEISWADLNNCLLKDTLLTIDFKSNKVIQQLIDEKTGVVNEKEFNDFCREQLRRADASI